MRPHFYYLFFFFILHEDVRDRTRCFLSQCGLCCSRHVVGRTHTRVTRTSHRTHHTTPHHSKCIAAILTYFYGEPATEYTLVVTLFAVCDGSDLSFSVIIGADTILSIDDPADA